MTRRIVILGPESTGKSTLSEQLANYYNTTWVPEYAREHLMKHGAKYTYDDLLTIARRQIILEDETVETAKRGLIFIDTDMYVMKIWCEFVYGRCHQWILDRIAERKYSLWTAFPKDFLRQSHRCMCSTPRSSNLTARRYD